MLGEATVIETCPGIFLGPDSFLLQDRIHGKTIDLYSTHSKFQLFYKGL